MENILIVHHGQTSGQYVFAEFLKKNQKALACDSMVIINVKYYDWEAKKKIIESCQDANSMLVIRNFQRLLESVNSEIEIKEKIEWLQSLKYKNWLITTYTKINHADGLSSFASLLSRKADATIIYNMYAKIIDQQSVSNTIYW